MYRETEEAIVPYLGQAGRAEYRVVVIVLQVIPVQVVRQPTFLFNYIIVGRVSSPVVPLLDIPGDGFIVQQGSRNSNCSD